MQNFKPVTELHAFPTSSLVSTPVPIYDTQQRRLNVVVIAAVYWRQSCLLHIYGSAVLSVVAIPT